jgi:hypothetical protein
MLLVSTMATGSFVLDGSVSDPDVVYNIYYRYLSFGMAMFFCEALQTRMQSRRQNKATVSMPPRPE